jgi:hypothetical protein
MHSYKSVTETVMRLFLDLHMLSAKPERCERVKPHSSHPENYSKIKSKTGRVLHVTQYSAYLE